MATHPMRDGDIDELVDPQMGIITGFQVLLDELETLRKIDLGDTPPAQGLQRTKTAKTGGESPT